MRPVDVAVLGAGGIIARAIVRDLAESPEVGGLLLLDVDGERATRVAAEHGGGRARALALDARDGGLAEALAGCRVLVNAASYRLNIVAMEAALQAGCDYLDLGGRVRELGDEPAAEIRVAAAGRDPEPTTRLRAPYALQTLIDELSMNPVVLDEREPVELAPLTDGGVVPDPIGEVATIHTLHSELRTFGPSFGVRRASFRLSLAPELLVRLEALRGAAAREVAAAQAAAAPPPARALSAHVVEVCGEDGRAVRVSASGIVSTAAPAAALVRLLARGRIDATGVHPPETCVDPDDLFPELERRGCRFEVTLA